MTGVVGIIMLGAFLAVVIAQLALIQKPPLAADVAPSEPPQLLCPTPTTNGAASGSASSTAPSTPPNGSKPAEPNGSPTSPASPHANDSRTVVWTCDAKHAVYAPQFRGSYDPVARLTALLAVVTPLVTSIVAFYFGQKAGSSEGRAATVQANAAIAQAQGSVKSAAKLGADQQKSLVEELEKAKVVPK